MIQKSGSGETEQRRHSHYLLDQKAHHPMFEQHVLLQMGLRENRYQVELKVAFCSYAYSHSIRQTIARHNYDIRYDYLASFAQIVYNY